LASSSEDAHLTFTRSGGLLGRPLPSVEVSELELSEEEAAAWAEVLRSGVLDREIPSGSAAGGDEYQYDLIVRRGHDERSLRFTEFDVPPELGGLIALLERRAEEEARRAGPEP
jgi:hypothetical protein